jgi:hypothetical protein
MEHGDEAGELTWDILLQVLPPALARISASVAGLRTTVRTLYRTIPRRLEMRTGNSASFKSIRILKGLDTWGLLA